LKVNNAGCAYDFFTGYRLGFHKKLQIVIKREIIQPGLLVFLVLQFAAAVALVIVTSITFRFVSHLSYFKLVIALLGSLMNTLGFLSKIRYRLLALLFPLFSLLVKLSGKPILFPLSSVTKNSYQMSFQLISRLRYDQDDINL